MRHKQLKEQKDQNGRSMVEMLGVLAVIGILSVTGVVAYQWAITKHRANELIHEAGKRAIVVATQLQADKDASLVEFAGVTVNGSSFDFKASDGESVYNKGEPQFAITVDNVAADVCKQMVNTVGSNAVVRKIIKAGNETALTTSECVDNIKVGIVYNADMSLLDVGCPDDKYDTEACCTENGGSWDSTNEVCCAVDEDGNATGKDMSGAVSEYCCPENRRVYSMDENEDIRFYCCPFGTYADEYGYGCCPEENMTASSAWGNVCSAYYCTEDEVLTPLFCCGLDDDANYPTLGGCCPSEYVFFDEDRPHCCAMDEDGNYTGKDTEGNWAEYCCSWAYGDWDGENCIVCAEAMDEGGYYYYTGKDLDGNWNETCCSWANGNWDGENCGFCAYDDTGKDTDGNYTEACCTVSEGDWNEEGNVCCMSGLGVARDEWQNEYCCSAVDGAWVESPDREGYEDHYCCEKDENGNITDRLTMQNDYVFEPCCLAAGGYYMETYGDEICCAMDENGNLTGKYIDGEDNGDCCSAANGSWDGTNCMVCAMDGDLNYTGKDTDGNWNETCCSWADGSWDGDYCGFCAYDEDGNYTGKYTDGNWNFTCCSWADGNLVDNAYGTACCAVDEDGNETGKDIDGNYNVACCNAIGGDWIYDDDCDLDGDTSLCSGVCCRADDYTGKCCGIHNGILASDFWSDWGEDDEDVCCENYNVDTGSWGLTGLTVFGEPNSVCCPDERRIYYYYDYNYNELFYSENMQYCCPEGTYRDQSGYGCCPSTDETVAYPVGDNLQPFGLVDCGDYGCWFTSYDPTYPPLCCNQLMDALYPTMDGCCEDWRTYVVYKEEVNRYISYCCSEDVEWDDNGVLHCCERDPDTGWPTGKIRFGNDDEYCISLMENIE